MFKNQSSFDSLTGLEAFARDSTRKAVLLDCLELGRFRKFEEGHCTHVAFLAMELFHSLSSIHGLSENEGNLLLAGALLHDVGCTIDYSKHHKHSRDLILAQPLKCFSSEENLIVANIARYHRKGSPKLSHRHFSSLSIANQRKLEILASLVRIADGMDRLHCNRIQKISTEIGEKIIFWVFPKGIYELENTIMKKKADLFFDLFHLGVELKSQ